MNLEELKKIYFCLKNYAILIESDDDKIVQDSLECVREEIKELEETKK